MSMSTIHQERGVETFFNDVVTRFEGDRRVERVITKRGQRVDCDFAVVGVGVEPVVDFVADSGVETSNGILVDEYCRTNVQDIYAAGDVANHYHPVFQKRMRVEHWQNAMQQSAAAARSMLDRGKPYDAVHWFWSDQYDVNLQYAGFHQAWDQVVVRGNLDTRNFIAFLSKPGAHRCRRRLEPREGRPPRHAVDQSPYSRRSAPTGRRRRGPAKPCRRPSQWSSHMNHPQPMRVRRSRNRTQHRKPSRRIPSAPCRRLASRSGWITCAAACSRAASSNG